MARNNATDQIITLKEKIQSLEKEVLGVKAQLTSREASDHANSKAKKGLIAEIDSVHFILDNLGGTCPRKMIGTSEWGSEVETEANLVARLASWLGTRAK
jgi:hypothetical protein